jgi:hypothetical protein
MLRPCVAGVQFAPKLYTVPRLLIIDEIGYLPIDAPGPTSSSSSSPGATRRGQ